MEHKILEFGVFQFDTRRQALSQNGLPIRLSASQIRLLTLFLERPLEIVSRDDITDRLWTDTSSIDISSGINTAVNRLRSYLGDNSTTPAYIETVVGLGYRFIAPITTIISEPVLSAPVPETGTSWPLPRTVLFVSSCVFVALVVTGLLLRIRPGGKASRPEEKLSIVIDQGHSMTFDDLSEKLSAQAISPTGKFLASADVHGVTLQTFASQDAHLLDPLKGLAVERIAWFSDETALLVTAKLTGTNSQQTDETPQSRVLVVSLDASKPRIVLDDATSAVPSPDGKRIAYLRRGGTELWISDAEGQSNHRLTQTSNGDTLNDPVWSPNGKRVVADRMRASVGNYAGADLAPGISGEKRSRGVYESYDAQTGALLFHRDDIIYNSAVLLSNGLMIYVPVDNQATAQIALVKTDLNSGAFLSDPAFVPDIQVLKFPVSQISDISATTDGSHLSVILDRPNIDVYTADLVGVPSATPSLEHVTQLTRHTTGNYPTAWTPDGNAVIFDATYSGFVSDGSITIASQPIEGSAGTLLAKAKSGNDRFSQGKFSPDGHWLLYDSLNPRTGNVASILRMPAQGGTPVVVPTTGPIEAFRCSISRRGRCVLREIDEQKNLVYYELDPVLGMGRELVRTPWEQSIRGDWSVSPDGSTIAVANHDPAHPSVRLVRLPAAGSPTGGHAATDEYDVPGYGVVLSAAWVPDGTSLFLETFTTNTYHMLWMNFHGAIKQLNESSGLIWAVPSPDGSKIAFPANTLHNRNVWLGLTQFGSHTKTAN